MIERRKLLRMMITTAGAIVFAPALEAFAQAPTPTEDPQRRRIREQADAILAQISRTKARHFLAEFVTRWQHLGFSDDPVVDTANLRNEINFATQVGENISALAPASLPQVETDILRINQAWTGAEKRDFLAGGRAMENGDIKGIPDDPLDAGPLAVQLFNLVFAGKTTAFIAALTVTQGTNDSINHGKDGKIDLTLTLPESSLSLPPPDMTKSLYHTQLGMEVIPVSAALLLPGFLPSGKHSPQDVIRLSKTMLDCLEKDADLETKLQMAAKNANLKTAETPDSDRFNRVNQMLIFAFTALVVNPREAFGSFFTSMSPDLVMMFEMDWSIYRPFWDETLQAVGALSTAELAKQYAALIPPLEVSGVRLPGLNPGGKISTPEEPAGFIKVPKVPFPENTPQPLQQLINQAVNNPVIQLYAFFGASGWILNKAREKIRDRIKKNRNNKSEG